LSAAGELSCEASCADGSSGGISSGSGSSSSSGSGGGDSSSSSSSSSSRNNGKSSKSLTTNSTAMFAGVCPISTEAAFPALAWLVNETCVLQAIQSDSSNKEICQLVSFVNFVEEQQSFPGMMESFLLTNSVFQLAMLASIPTPDNIIGIFGFFCWLLCLCVQYAAVMMSLVVFLHAAASAGIHFKACLVDWKPGYKMFNILAFGAGGIQPIVIANLSVLLLYGSLLAEAWRVWRWARDDKERYEERGMSNDLILFAGAVHGLWPLLCIVACFFSASFVFGLAFLPTALFQAALMAVLLVFYGKVHEYTKKHKDEKKWGCMGINNLLYYVTTPYHYFSGTKPEEMDGAGVIMAALISSGSFIVSTFVTFGMLLAFYTYAGHTSGETNQLIDEVYLFQYDCFRRSPEFWFPMFDLTLSLPELQQVLETIQDLPGLEWGPENFVQVARGLMTLNFLMGLGLAKCALSVLYAVLACCHFTSPSISTAYASRARAFTRQLSEVKRDREGTGMAAVANAVTGAVANATTNIVHKSKSSNQTATL
jgi:hypothetical protein